MGGIFDSVVLEPADGYTCFIDQCCYDPHDPPPAKPVPLITWPDTIYADDGFGLVTLTRGAYGVGGWTGRAYRTATKALVRTVNPYGFATCELQDNVTVPVLIAVQCVGGAWGSDADGGSRSDSWAATLACYTLCRDSRFPFNTDPCYEGAIYPTTDEGGVLYPFHRPTSSSADRYWPDACPPALSGSITLLDTPPEPYCGGEYVLQPHPLTRIYTFPVTITYSQ